MDSAKRLLARLVGREKESRDYLKLRLDVLEENYQKQHVTNQNHADNAVPPIRHN